MNLFTRLSSASLVVIALLCSAHVARSAPEGTADGYKENISFVQGLVASQDRNVVSDFSWIDKSGKKISMKDLRGKTVFINFWGTWCRPCRMELPDIVALVKQYEGDVVFLGIAMERPGNADVLNSLVGFTKEQKMTYQNVVGTEELAQAFGGLSGIPTTFVIDKNGKISGSLVGMRDRKAFEELLKKAQ